MPFTPEAQAKAGAVYDWFRRRLVLIIVVIMLLLQFLTWRELVDLKRYFPSSPPDCDSYRPCYFELDENSLRQLRPR